MHCINNKVKVAQNNSGQNIFYGLIVPAVFAQFFVL